MLLAKFIEVKKNEAKVVAHVNHNNEQIKISGNYLLDFFDIKKCNEIDDRSQLEPFINSKRRKCLENLRGSGLLHSPSFSGAIQAYNEILIYDELKKRIEVIGRDGKGPDFIVSKPDVYNINVDLKTILFNDAHQNFIDYQKQKAVSEIETQNAKAGIFPFNKKFASIEISPFLKFKGVIPKERKIIIESLIDKLTNQSNYQQLTFEGRNGIQIIDTLILRFPYFPQDGLKEYLYPLVAEYPSRALFSGCLWYSCFGNPGDNIADFTGVDCLTKAGILTNTNQYQKAIIFIMRHGGGSSGTPILCGFHRSEGVPDDILKCMYEICDFVNDEKNSNPFSLSTDPLDNYKVERM